MYFYSYSCIYIHIHVFLFIFIFLYSYSYSSIHIHLFILIFMYFYSYSSFYIHIHLFISIFIYLYSHSSTYIHVIFFTSRYLFSHSCCIFTFIVMYAWFCSFICMVYFHGTRECECITSEVHIHVQPTKTILWEFNNSRQCILVWSSCLDQPRVHLKFPDDVMPSITRNNISHNFALSN